MKVIKCPEPWGSDEKTIESVLVLVLIVFSCILIILYIFYQENLFKSNWLALNWCLFPILIFFLIFCFSMVYLFRKGNRWSLSLPSNTNLLRNLAQDIESLLKEDNLNFSKKQNENDNILQSFKIKMPSNRSIEIFIRSNWISFDYKEEEKKRLNLDNEKFSFLEISNITLKDLPKINDIQSKIINVLDKLDYKNVLDDFY